MTAAQMWKNVLGRRTAWALLWSFFIALQTLQPAKTLLLAGLEPASSSLILLPSPLYLTNRNAFVLTQDRLLLSVSPDSAPVGHSRAHSLTPLYCSLHTALTNPLVLPSCLLPRAVLQYPSQSR